MAFIPFRDFLSIWHFKLIGLIGPRAVSEKVKHTNLSIGISLANSCINMSMNMDTSTDIDKDLNTDTGTDTDIDTDTDMVHVSVRGWGCPCPCPCLCPSSRRCSFCRRCHLKGTVARDFLVSVFFMDILYMGPRFRG
jgi:hypothetical protein